MGSRTMRPVLVGAALVAVSLPVFARAARRERDRRLFWTLACAQQLKLCGALARHHVAYNVYHGVADAEGYHGAGMRLARRFRAGDLDPGMRPVTGTNFVRLVTGALYTLIGPSRVAGFFVFSWLGFWGLYFFSRAFALAVPGGRDRAYARLLFFLPSLLFWPSSIGKDAWMVFSLGVGALGGGRAVSDDAHRPLALDALGMSLAACVRPHVAGMLGASLSTGYLVGGRRARAVSIGVFAAALALRANRYLRRSGIATEEGVESTVQQTTRRTAMGGSQFTPPSVRSPARAPLVPATVLFRPHVLEAHNVQALAAALEASFLLLITLRRAGWVRAAVADARRQPYVAIALAYTGLFTTAYAGAANFGLLVRQRVQLLPFYLVLLSVPPSKVTHAPRLRRP